MHVYMTTTVQAVSWSRGGGVNYLGPVGIAVAATTARSALALGFSEAQTTEDKEEATV